MFDYADLTIELSRPAENLYWVELSFSQPDGQTEQAPRGAPVRFDFPGLRAAAFKPDIYGDLLQKALFGQEALRSFFSQCRANAGGAGQELRLRVLVDRSAVELQNLRWETLCDPEREPAGRAFLASNANQPFSRFLYSSDWQRVDLRSKGQLRALVVVANPSELAGGLELDGQKLAEVDVVGEVRRARAGLAGIPLVEVLESRAAEPGRASFEILKSQLALGMDILYLVVHGALLSDDPDDPASPQRPFLLFEKSDGSYDRVDGNRLLNLVRDLPSASRPRLVVLASCQSGGQGRVPGSEPDEPERSYDRGALAALGPRLVEAGVPAVVAMQDNIKMETVRRFIPEFFKDLVRHGQVDKAIAVARSLTHAAGCSDWWVPVLYVRLRGGCLWYEPGFVSETPEFGGWPNIANSIKQGYCVPVLGFGMLEFLAGSPREISRRWARDAGYPLDPHHREDFAQVAQYLSIQQSLAYPRDQFLEHLRERLLAEHQPILPAGAQGLSLEALISEIGRWRRTQDPAEAYCVLASLPFKTYITANPDNLLEQALIDSGRPPVVLYSRWRRSLINDAAIQEVKNLPEPSFEAPLVYHLFGYIGNRKSMILAEDDYFEYMMWVNNPSAQVPVPDPVMTAWREDALLFLGFQMSDWNFRVLFRSILNEERRLSVRDYRSVAVQLQPGDGYLKPESARRYLERAFAKDQLDIYWGSGEDFLRELKSHWH